MFIGRIFSLFVILLCQAAFGQATTPRAVIVSDGDSALAAALADSVAQTGYEATTIDFDALVAPGALTAVDLLVLPDAATLPADSVEPIHAYLLAGGDLVALNTPMWQTPLVRDEGGWITRDVFLERHAVDLMGHELFSFAPEKLTGWARTSNNSTSSALHESVPAPDVPSGHALHVVVEDLTGWDTFISPVLDKPFPAGHELTVFWARGGPRTTELAIEWREADQSRWFATVPLTNEWQRYVLEPADFRFWESLPSRASTAFNPANATQVAIGLAHSHTNVGDGRHEYWVGPFGTAERTARHELALAKFKAPLLETLAPAYKFFDVNDAAKLRVVADQLDLARTALPMPAAYLGLHPRPEAGGFNKGRDWRWQPLLELETASGEWRGNPATVLVHADGPYKGGVWASFAINDPAWYASQAAQDLLTATAAFIRRGVYLIDGGANFYTYFEDQTPTFGARVFNARPDSPQNFTVELQLETNNGNVVYDHHETITLSAFTEQTWMESVEPVDWSSNGLHAIARLIDDNGTVLDVARHEVNVWRPKPSPLFITTQKGDFILDGERWRPHGVNYMPSSGIGTEDWQYFEQWIGARAYDPKIIQRDLEHCRDMGMNTVSIFIYRESMEAQNLLDLLRRLDALGMKANLSLRPGTPMDFQWDAMRDMIAYYRLAQNDTVFAYDLAWEPMFGDQKDRRAYDSLWRDWIAERYGSIENAEADWSFPAPRDESGAVTNPGGKQITSDGPWRVMVAAYRRFLDTLLYEKYAEARRLVRTIDPNHLISFRMTEACNPTFRWDKHIPYGWLYLSGAVDILEPEAYGRIGDWEKVKPGWFQFEYARWVAPDLPMMWAEAGVSAWSRSEMRSTEKALQFEADYYTDLYRMFIGSGADGIFFWWYPGGYRTNEHSDYGVINPDGSDRPVTKVIRKHADALINGPDAAPVDHWITIDRDAHPDGVTGIYDKAKDEFWAAIDAGKTPGLRTEGTGTTSANAPRLAIGNTPLTGKNPPKYLDGFFDVIEVRNANGDWERVLSGSKITISGNEISLRVTVTNLAEATWLTPVQSTEPNGVYITSWIGTTEHRFPLPKDLARLETVTLDNLTLPTPDGATSQETPVSLGFLADGVAIFGPVIEFSAVLK